MTQVFSNLSRQAKIEAALKMAIIDAIENNLRYGKGELSIEEIKAYMETNTFKNSVENYLNMMNDEQIQTTN